MLYTTSYQYQSLEVSLKCREKKGLCLREAGFRRTVQTKDERFKSINDRLKISGTA